MDRPGQEDQEIIAERPYLATELVAFGNTSPAWLILTSVAGDHKTRAFEPLTKRGVRVTRLPAQPKAQTRHEETR